MAQALKLKSSSVEKPIFGKIDHFTGALKERDVPNIVDDCITIESVANLFFYDNKEEFLSKWEFVKINWQIEL